MLLLEHVQFIGTVMIVSVGRVWTVEMLLDWEMRDGEELRRCEMEEGVLNCGVDLKVR